MVNFFSSIHFWWVDFTLDHDQPQRPCTSPRSMARPTSLPPGYPVTTFILVPSTPLTIFGNWSVSADELVPPTTSSLVSRSSNLVMPLVRQATQIETSLLALPIQVNFGPSNCALALLSRGSKPVPRPMMPIAEPSFGATL